MAITNLQQARQMYQTGQRVAKTLDGSRPGYRGDYSYGDPSSKDYDPGEGTNQAGKSAPTASVNRGSDNYRAPTYDAPPTVQQMKDAKRDYEVGIAGGYAKDTGNNFIGPMPYGVTLSPYNQFLSTRPDFKPLPPLGPFSLLTNVFNKPFQKLSDFTTKKNRDFFMNEVVRAGKIPGVNYATIAEMTNEELEEAYQNYLSDRVSGETDAYGNPIGDNVGGDNDQGIATLYNYDMFDDSNVDENMKVANDPFVSRFLQTQPSDIKEGIESRMQNYYTTV